VEQIIKHRNSLLLFPIVAVLIFVIAAQMGCQTDFLSPQGERPSSLNENRTGMQSNSMTNTCITSLGILPPSLPLTLLAIQSQAVYNGNSVVTLTPVSFSICDLDTTGLPLLPVSIELGPDHNFRFLKDVIVHMRTSDAGLIQGDPNNRNFMIYRLNESTGRWEFHDNPGIDLGSVFTFKTRINGIFALGPLDTSWIASGYIYPATGGTINLLTSSFQAPAGAVNSLTIVTFTIMSAIPEGLPGATDRIFTFEPEGVVFNTPCTAYISFEDAGITEEKVPRFHFYYFDPTLATWVRQPTVIDWGRHQFVVPMSHFSRYAFGR